MRKLAIVYAATIITMFFWNSTICYGDNLKVGQKRIISQPGRELVCPDSLDVSNTTKAEIIPPGGWEGAPMGSKFHLQVDGNYINNNIMFCSYRGTVGFSIYQKVPGGMQCEAMKRTVTKGFYFICK